MARARMLKPGFFTNETLGTLPPLARLLFQGLWCLADRAGRLEDRPKRIKAQVLPYDRGDPDRLLALLAETVDDEGVPFILRYSVGPARYIQIVAFTDHQHPHPNEPASTIPANGASPHVNVTSPSDIGGSTQAESIPSESESLAESLAKIPPNPPQAGGRAERAKNGSRRRRDVEALKEQRAAVPVEQQLEEARARLLPAVRRGA